MSQDFTRYLHSLSADGEPPGREEFDRLWQALRKAMVSELRRRGLWELPPQYLGVLGWQNWSAVDDGAAGGDDALDELVADAYQFIFLDRLQALRAQLATKPTLEGLVFRNLRNFLFERQRKNDPVGYRAYEALRGAVRQAVKAGWLRIAEGDPRVGNATRLAFVAPADPVDSDGPAAAPASGQSPAGEASPVLAEIAAGWAAELVPALVTRPAAARAEARERLLERLRELPRAGVESFTFKEALDPFKAALRPAWAALFDRDLGEAAVEEGDEGLLRLVRVSTPDAAPDERRQLAGIDRCVLRRVGRLEVDPTTRGYLLELWRFLAAYALSPDTDRDGRPPSGRKTAALLGIPRERLPELKRVLGDAVERCRATTPAGGDVT